jgi:hypothetical protein
VEELCHNYRLSCRHSHRCLKGKDHGADRVRALHVASQHVFEHPTHVVELLDNAQPIQLIRYGGDQLELPFATLSAEVTGAAKTAQKNLREALDKRLGEAQAIDVPQDSGTPDHQEGTGT